MIAMGLSCDCEHTTFRIWTDEYVSHVTEVGDAGMECQRKGHGMDEMGMVEETEKAANF